MERHMYVHLCSVLLVWMGIAQQQQQQQQVEAPLKFDICFLIRLRAEMDKKQLREGGVTYSRCGAGALWR